MAKNDNDSKEVARFVRMAQQQVELNGTVSASLCLEMIAHMRDLKRENDGLRSAQVTMANLRQMTKRRLASASG